MMDYPDTSFLCAMYRSQVNSPKAAAYFAGMAGPLRVSSPLLFEFRQSTRWQVYLNSNDATKGFDLPSAQAALAMLQANIGSGALMIVPVDWADVASIADRLSAQHTFTKGYRAFDILHVATAIHLGATDFLTFDGKQKQLAKAEGLRLPLG